MADDVPDYDALVFSGGGLRCFWQGGFMEALGERRPEPERITALSGGALSAACFVSGCGEALLGNMREAFRQNDSNLKPYNLDENNRVLIHEDVYRAVIEKTFAGEETRRRIAGGPEFSILLARPPWPRGGLGACLAVTAHELDLHTRKCPHLIYARRLGARPVWTDARQAARDGRLVELLVAAATIPPFFSRKQWNGCDIVDGGVLDNAPAPERAKNTMILLTRRYDRIPDIQGRTYIQPGAEPEVDKIDFTDDEGLEKAWAQGRKDGEAFLQT